jgi:hypothetical protein
MLLVLILVDLLGSYIAFGHVAKRLAVLWLLVRNHEFFRVDLALIKRLVTYLRFIDFF